MIISLFQPADGDNINIAAQQNLKIVLQMEKIKQRTPLLELDQEVNVTIHRLFASRDRPEDRRGDAAVLVHECVNALSVLFDLLSDCLHDGQITSAV